MENAPTQKGMALEEAFREYQLLQQIVKAALVLDGLDCAAPETCSLGIE